MSFTQLTNWHDKGGVAYEYSSGSKPAQYGIILNTAPKEVKWLNQGSRLYDEIHKANINRYREINYLHGINGFYVDFDTLDNNEPSFFYNKSRYAHIVDKEPSVVPKTSKSDYSKIEAYGIF